MQDFEEDHYQILGIEEKAGPDEVRKAYLKLAKKLHPDRFPNDPEKKAAAQQEFAKVTRAHEVLSDAKQKEEYDAVRNLARSRQALDMGMPGMPGTSSPSVTAAQAAATQNLETSGSGVRPENKEAWASKHAQRGKDYAARKKFQEAETAIKEAIRLDPYKTQYRVLLAEVYMNRGWKTLAMTEVQTALRLDPDDADAKQIEMKLKASPPTKSKAVEEKKGGFLNQLSKLLGKK